MDGKECIVLDHSDTSLLAHWIRDEIRAVGQKSSAPPLAKEIKKFLLCDLPWE
jgi:hypothetical protein